MTSNWIARRLHSNLYSVSGVLLSSLVVDPGGCHGDRVPVGVIEPDASGEDGNGNSPSPEASAPGEGGPAGGAVWSAQSAGFELDLSGSPQMLPDADVCSGLVRTYDYNASSRTLTLTGCQNGLPIAGAAQLSADSGAALLARLSTLMPTGPTSGCGADLPDMVLTVFDASGAQRRYVSDFYSGCVSVQGVITGPGPYLPYAALSDLDIELYRFTVACLDGGSTNDAGATCVALPSDAGAPPG